MFGVLFTVLALTPAQGVGFPLEKGLRWTYDYRGYEMVTVDVVATTIEDEEKEVCKEVSVLAVVGEWLFTHDGRDIYVTSDDGGFAVHGSRFERYDEPLVFVQPPLKVGAKWHSETIGRRTYGARQLAFDATVLARETITVPAGEFDAWKIGIINDGETPATPRDFTAWFVPDIGFVKYEYRYNSYPWRGYLLPSPIVCQLKESGKLPYGYPIEYPEITGQQQSEAKRLLTSLWSDDAELNQLAHEGLVGLGPGVIPVLLESLDKEEVAKRRLRIKKLLQEFATIEIVAFTNQPSARVGEPLSVEFRIRNVGSAPMPVASALDKSDRGRYPAYIIEVRNSEGKVLNVDPPIGCGNTNPLREQDVVVLEPGDELNPFPARGLHYMLNWWSPEKPGTYTVRCIYEAGVGDNAAKGNPYSRWHMWPSTPVLLSLIHRMPHGRIVSNEVSVVVEE